MVKKLLIVSISVFLTRNGKANEKDEREHAIDITGYHEQNMNISVRNLSITIENR